VTDKQFAIGFLCGSIFATSILFGFRRYYEEIDTRPTRIELVKAGLAEWTVDEYGYVDFRMKVDVKAGGAK